MVAHGQEKIAHLTIGLNLAPQWTRTDSFHKACPSIATKPLFLEKFGKHQYLGREFINGHSVAELLQAGKLTATEVHAHIVKIQEMLAGTHATSDVSSAKAEAAHVFGQIQQIPHLSTVDKVLFDTLLAPLVYAGIESTSPSTRWTNGDFTAHNLIISTDGCARLIDCEFAHRTHFPSEDLWRWLNFSHLPASQFAMLPNHTSSPPPWLEIFFWTKQLVLSHRTALPAIAQSDSAHAIAQIARLSSAARVPLGSGFFAQTLCEQSETESKVARLKIERDELRDKILRMENSRSWKVSAPLRAIRRWLSR
ncbi:MAG: hypothetical protein QM760_13550 [Nibricoccus sp.]